MLGLLPHDLILTLASYVTLPYFLKPRDEELWGFLQPHLPVGAQKPSKHQVRLLWTYWNHHRWYPRGLVSALRAGLRYVPLIKRHFHALWDSADQLVARAIIATGDVTFYQLTLKPILEEEGDQLRFDKGLAQLVEEALEASDWAILRNILAITAQHEDEPMGDRSYALAQACRQYFYRHPQPFSQRRIRKLQQLLRENSDEHFLTLPRVMLSAYDSPQHAFFTHSLHILDATERKELLAPKPELHSLLRSENLEAIRTLLPFGDALSLLRTLFDFEQVSTSYYEQVFALAYRVELPLGQLLSEYVVCSGNANKHLRFIRALHQHEAVGKRLSEFIEHLNARVRWNAAALVTVLQALNPAWDADEARRAAGVV